jgi:futalosine hydrolase
MDRNRTLILGAVEQEIGLLAAAFKVHQTHEITGKTAREGLCGTSPAVLAVCGIGAVNAAQVVTACIERFGISSVIMVGCAGAYRGGGLSVGDVAVAAEEVYGHLGVLVKDGWQPLDATGLNLLPEGKTVQNNVFPLDRELCGRWLEAAQKTAFAKTGRFLTVDAVSGDDWTAKQRFGQFRAVVENMEGAAAAHVCALYGIPFQEIRGVSNRAGDRDKKRWDLDRAVTASQQAVLKAHEENVW